MSTKICFGTKFKLSVDLAVIDSDRHVHYVTVINCLWNSSIKHGIKYENNKTNTKKSRQLTFIMLGLKVLNSFPSISRRNPVIERVENSVDSNQLASVADLH